MRTKFRSSGRTLILPLLLLLFSSKAAEAQDAAVAVKADATSKADATGKAKSDETGFYTPTNRTDENETVEVTEAERARRAKATEGWLMTGVFAAGTGLQGGDTGQGMIAWTRVRTRILAGVDLRNDETRSGGFGVYGFAEIEQRATFGAELRYQRFWSPAIGFHVAAVGVIAPSSMIGPGIGARFGFPIGKVATLFLEPGFTAFVLGNDLPNKNVVVWGTLIGGVGLAL